MCALSEASVQNRLIATGSNKADEMDVRLLCLYVLCWLQTLRGTDRFIRRFVTGGYVCVCVCVCVLASVCIAVSDPKNSKMKWPRSEFVYCAIKRILCLP